MNFLCKISNFNLLKSIFRHISLQEIEHEVNLWKIPINFIDIKVISYFIPCWYCVNLDTTQSSPKYPYLPLFLSLFILCWDL